MEDRDLDECFEEVAAINSEMRFLCLELMKIAGQRNVPFEQVSREFIANTNALKQSLDHVELLFPHYRAHDLGILRRYPEVAVRPGMRLFRFKCVGHSYSPYFSGTNLLDLVAPNPGAECLTLPLVIENSPI